MNIIIILSDNSVFVIIIEFSSLCKSPNLVLLCHDVIGTRENKTLKGKEMKVIQLVNNETETNKSSD